MTTAKEAMQALAIPHELDDMPPKVLRELSAAEFGAYITHLRNQARELQRARQERDDARAGCKGLSDKLAAFIESAGADSERYRWLRDGCDDKLSEATRIAANCYGIEWDAAIDSAIARSTQKEPGT